MQLTQIQGQNIGQNIQVAPQAPQVSLPVVGQNLPYIQDQNGQKILVPQGSVSVSVNAQPISSPTPIQHGDVIAMEHPNSPPTVIAVHHPEQKLQAEHIGDYVRKAGLNLKDEQILALVKEIENAEKKKFLLMFATLGGVIFLLIIGIVFLWFLLGGKASMSDNESLQKKLTALQNDIQSLNEEKEDQPSVSQEEIDTLKEKIDALTLKVEEAQSQKATLDEATQAQINEILQKFQMYSEELSNTGDFNERVKKFEEMLQSTEVGEKLQSAQYYMELQNRCNGNECCTNSVKIMMENSYKLSENDQCSVGEKINRLKCMDSYVWCIPDGSQGSSLNEQNPQNTGGIIPAKPL